MHNSHWAAIWGNAVSIAENRPERYARNITLRYPVRVPLTARRCGSPLIITAAPSPLPSAKPR